MTEIKNIKINEAGFRELEKEGITLLKKIAIDVQDTAKGLAPVRTGALRDSITASVETESLTAIIGSDLDYAIFVELGTRKQAPQPYLRQALSSSTTEIQGIFGG